MKWTGLNELREQYLAFFEEKEHLRLESFPLLPQGDQTLLLINSGMAPMKKWFSGQEIPPCHRVTTCQKCIRTPDIDNVGKTARHGTFFEMLGNFSFGDYFKQEAVAWAFEFVTKRLALPLDRLWFSIYHDDPETKDLWVGVGVSPDRVVSLGKADNFWEIGAGPCGPCSEIYFDRGAEYGCDSPTCAVGCDCDRYVEFWNLVFTQFHNDGNNNYSPLAHPNIDTGMGLERLACILQGVDNLFEVDTVQNIMAEVSKLTEVAYHEDASSDVSLRVITDHIRATVFLLADGVSPSNEGRGYVLRRLLRRAARHGYLLGVQQPFLYRLVEVVLVENQLAYPYLSEKQAYLTKVIQTEEESFNRTISHGMELLTACLAKVQAKHQADGAELVLSGEDAFRLYDTYGFPLDLVKEIALEQSVTVEEDRFATLMAEQKQRAREARAGAGAADHAFLVSESEEQPLPPTQFVGYPTATSRGAECEATATLLAIVLDGGQAVERLTVAETASAEQVVTLIFDRTPFYTESGGQASDSGTILGSGVSGTVLSLQKAAGDLVLHRVSLAGTGSLCCGDQLTLLVDLPRRRATARNHTAAHLLQTALRTVLGDHVHQAGQMVDDAVLRFDFTHFEALTREECTAVESLVNDYILSGYPVEIAEMSLAEAKETGAMALFSEKYGDRVRVVTVRDENNHVVSSELCGGTHSFNTSNIGLLKIVSESSVAAGIRRIEARTGRGVLGLLEQAEQLLAQSCVVLKASTPASLPDKCVAIAEEARQQRKQLEQLQAKLATAQTGDLFAEAVSVGNYLLVTKAIPGIDLAALRTMGDDLKGKAPNLVVVLCSVDEQANKGNVFCVCSPDAVKAGVHAGKIVSAVAGATGGKGGGRPDSATGGIADVAKLAAALAEVSSLLPQ